MARPDIDYYLFGTHVRFGDGCAMALAQELKALGCRRPVILTQPRMSASADYARLRESCTGLAILESHDIPQHGDLDVLEALAERARAHEADSIVAIGGGSVSDSAKALAMLLAEGGKLADHTTRFTPPASVTIPLRTRPKLPIVSLPTTASGAEVTPGFGVREGDHKLLFWNRHLASTAIFIDPVLSRDVPMALMRYTAMNGLAHCFEGMYSRNKSVVATGIALQSLALFASALCEHKTERSDQAHCAASDPDHDQRATILLAGHLSGVVLSMARTCLHHAICHVIGARHNVGHGAVNTVMLAHSLRFNAPVVHDDLAPALRVLNDAAGTHHHSPADWVEAVSRHWGLPMTLSALGLNASDLPAIAEHTLGERGLALNPRPVTTSADVLTILHHAL